MSKWDVPLHFVGDASFLWGPKWQMENWMIWCKRSFSPRGRSFCKSVKSTSAPEDVRAIIRYAIPRGSRLLRGRNLLETACLWSRWTTTACDDERKKARRRTKRFAKSTGTSTNYRNETELQLLVCGRVVIGEVKTSEKGGIRWMCPRGANHIKSARRLFWKWNS